MGRSDGDLSLLLLANVEKNDGGRIKVDIMTRYRAIGVEKVESDAIRWFERSKAKKRYEMPECLVNRDCMQGENKRGRKILQPSVTTVSVISTINSRSCCPSNYPANPNPTSWAAAAELDGAFSPALLSSSTDPLLPSFDPLLSPNPNPGGTPPPPPPGPKEEDLLKLGARSGEDRPLTLPSFPLTPPSEEANAANPRPGALPPCTPGAWGDEMGDPREKEEDVVVAPREMNFDAPSEGVVP